MPRPVTATEPPETAGVLPGATFCDAFEIAIDDGPVTARSAATAILGSMPGWALGLMALRNLLVAPFGLKSEAGPHDGAADRVGFFPVLDESAERIVLGLDDRHLDFRIILDVLAGAGTGRRIRLATAVKTHNALGRGYLASILVFHKAIIRTVMARARF